MNRRQRERVEDLGRVFTQAMEEIIEIGQDPIITERVSGGIEMTAPEEPTPNTAAEVYTAAPGMQNDRLAPYHVNIRQVHNGFIVEVGCQTFVFEKYSKLSEYLDMYYSNPTEAIRKHDEGKLF